MASPSPGYSITLRVEVSSSYSATTELASAVAATGAAVTALDIVESRHDRIVVDVTCNTAGRGARRRDHRRAQRARRRHRPQGQRPHLPAAPRRQARRSSPRCRSSNRDDLSRAYTPGVARVCLAIAAEPRGRPPADDQAQHRRRGHRRHGGAGPRRHRPGRRAAGDGGKGGAVQAVRRRRRLAGLPRHQGHRGDHRDRQGDGPGLRRRQPRGHRRAALLRDRAPTARRARHPRLPR